MITTVHLPPMATMRKSRQQIFGYRSFPPISACFGHIWNANRAQPLLQLILAQYTRIRPILLLPKGHGGIFYTTATTPHHTSLSMQGFPTRSDVQRKICWNQYSMSSDANRVTRHPTPGRKKRLAAASA